MEDYDINYHNISGNSPLHLVATHENTEITKTLCGLLLSQELQCTVMEISKIRKVTHLST